MNHLESKIEFFVIINANSPLLTDSSINNIEKIVISSNWISFGEQLELPSVLKKYDIDLFHTPSFVAPLIVPCKLVMTIHDLNHMVFLNSILGFISFIISWWFTEVFSNPSVF